jgi:hypothetical protein
MKTSVLSINNVHIKMTNYHKHAMFKMKTDKHPYSNTNKGSIQDLKFTTDDITTLVSQTLHLLMMNQYFKAKFHWVFLSFKSKELQN